MRNTTVATSRCRALGMRTVAIPLPGVPSQMIQGAQCLLTDVSTVQFAETLKGMFGGKKKAAAVPVRATRLSDARRASETGLMRRREEYRGGGGPTAGDADPTVAEDRHMNQTGDRIRLGVALLLLRLVGSCHALLNSSSRVLCFTWPSVCAHRVCSCTCEDVRIIAALCRYAAGCHCGPGALD